MTSQPERPHSASALAPRPNSSSSTPPECSHELWGQQELLSFNRTIRYKGHTRGLKLHLERIRDSSTGCGLEIPPRDASVQPPPSPPHPLRDRSYQLCCYTSTRETSTSPYTHAHLAGRKVLHLRRSCHFCNSPHFRHTLQFCHTPSLLPHPITCVGVSDSCMELSI